MILSRKFLIVLTVACSFALPSMSECISISPGECARHKDGSPQTCKASGNSGICIEVAGSCKCVAEPKSCDEYQSVYSDSTCYDCDGSRESCPIGKLITIDYGLLYGQIFCCCRNNGIKTVTKDKITNKVLSNDGSVNVLP